MKIKKYANQRNNDKLLGKLKSYSALAGSFLIGSVPAFGAVQYTDVDPDLQIASGGPYVLDVNNDSSGDVQFHFTFHSIPSLDLTVLELRAMALNPGNGVAAVFGEVAAYGSGVIIDGSLNFSNYGIMADKVGTSQGTTVGGPWVNTRFKNLGIKFQVAGQTHYGWARLSVEPSGSFGSAAKVTLHDYAWEDLPNTPIITPPLPPCEFPANINISNIRFKSIEYNWDPLPSAERYEIRGRKVSGPPGYTVLPIVKHFQSTLSIQNLAPDTDYEISMRSICLDSDTSQWSIPMTFHTLECMSPDSVYISDLTPTSAKLNWTPVPLDGNPKWYQVLGRPLGATKIVSIYVHPSVTSRQVNNLFPGTTYEWTTLMICQGDAVSPISMIDTFTTPTIAQKYRTPSPMEHQKSIAVTPHPIAGTSRIYFENEGSSYQLMLTDMNGKVVRMVNGITDNEFLLNKENLAPGMYILELKGEKYFVEKVLIE